jgi:integrase
MNFQKLNEFRFLREISIVNVVRETGNSVQKTLQMRVCDLPNLVSAQAIQHMKEYVSCRRSLFSNLDLLFPTENGSMFLSMKFKQNLRKLLALAGQPVSPSHPSKMTEQQIQAVLNLKFQYQRSKFQQILAASLLGFQGLRPGEVANLKKEDIDFDQKILILRETKSQEVQNAPIHQDLISPLEKYVNYLKQGEYLFVRSSKKHWTRKDVYHSAQDLGETFGIQGVNPRKLRSTAAHQMVSVGVHMNIVSEFLRHKDKATAPRHYTPVFDIELVREAMNSLQFEGNSDATQE